MNNKIIFTDMDGTLLPDSGIISSTLRQKLTELTNNGVILVLSSGRPLGSILQAVEESKLYFPNMYAIAYNGSLIYDLTTKSVLAEYRMNKQDAIDIYNLGLRENIYTQTYNDTHIIGPYFGEELAYYSSYIHIPYIIDRDPTQYIGKGPFKLLSIKLKDYSELDRFRTLINNQYGDKYSSSYSNIRYLEFFDNRSGKGNALTYLCNHLGISVDESVAFGDAENDVSMLQTAGHSVGMINGSQSVIDTADYITTKDCDHDGIIDGLNKFFDD